MADATEEDVDGRVMETRIAAFDRGMRKPLAGGVRSPDRCMCRRV